MELIAAGFSQLLEYARQIGFSQKQLDGQPLLHFPKRFNEEMCKICE
jgi:hypothetical protein